MSLDHALSTGDYPNLHPQHRHEISGIDPAQLWPDSPWRDALSCRDCARRSLLMLIKTSEWVARRVERVRFRDGRTASRQVTVDLMLPQIAPIFRTTDGKQYALVPLTVLRKKTLTNFTIAHGDGAPMSLIGLRWNQALTVQMLLVLGDTLNGGRVDDRSLNELAHQIGEGTQNQIMHAKKTVETLERTLEPGSDSLVWSMLRDVAVKSLIYRFAGNFLLLALLDLDGDLRRVIRFSYDEELSLKYNQGSPAPAADGKPPCHQSAEDKRSWWRRGLTYFTPWLSRLGFLPSTISFPTPAAENCQSYHFEITAPSGIQISAASMIAGRPNEASMEPSWDRVKGGFPVVGLHVWGVPNGSRSVARVGLKLARSGWLTVNAAASLFCTVLLFAVATFPPDAGAESSVVVVVTVGAAALTFVISSGEHDMMTRLVAFLRVVAILPLVLLLLEGTWVALHRHDLTRYPLYIFAGIALVCSVVLVFSYLAARRSEPFISPWEQGFNVGDHTDEWPRGNYSEMWSQLNFDQSATVVGSGEGEHFQFVWTQKAEDRLVRRLLELQYGGDPRS